MWADFTELPDRIGHAKQGAHSSEREQRFKRWRCPHCAAAVEVLLVGPKDRKADACKNHFWNKTSPCPSRPESDVRGKPKVASASTAAIEANTASVDQNTAVLRELLVLEKARADRWKRTSRGYHASSAVSSPHSSDTEGERESKRQRVRESNLVDGRRVELNRVVRALGDEAPEEPDDVDLSSARIKKRIVGVRKEASRAQTELGRVDEVLGLQPVVHTDERIGAIVQLNKAAAVASAAGSKPKPNRATEDRLRRERDEARMSIRNISREGEEARDLNSCFSDFTEHPTEAKALLRSVSMASHPDKHGGADTTTGKLATGLQAALNIVKARVEDKS